MFRTNRSPFAIVCAAVAFCVRSPFTIHSRSLNSVQRSLTVHSPCALRSLTNCSECAHPSCGKVCFRNCLKIATIAGKNITRIISLYMYMHRQVYHMQSFSKRMFSSKPVISDIKRFSAT